MDNRGGKTRMLWECTSSDVYMTNECLGVYTVDFESSFLVSNICR